MSPHLPLGSRASLHPGYKTEERKNAVVYNVIACVDLAVPEEGGTEGGGKILGRGEKGGSFEVGGGGTSMVHGEGVYSILCFVSIFLLLPVPGTPAGLV